MKKVFFFLVFHISALFVYSQPAIQVATAATILTKDNFSLGGKITNALTGEPLPGASIYIQDEKIGAVADANGMYRFQSVPGGHHLVEISHAGFLTIVEHIDLTGNMEKNFRLQPSIIEAEGVTVTGVTNATSVRNTPVPVTIMRRNELLRTTSTNIIDALTHKPGVSQVGTGPGISKPVIRGLGYNRVVVIHEGAKQEGQQWGDEHGIEIDESSIQKVEIIKGPASLIYGSDALAGVINILTNNPVQPGTIKGNAVINYQTNNNLYVAHGNMAGNSNGFNWNAYGTYKTAAAYQNKYDGYVLNSGFNEKNFGGYLGINKGWGYSHLIFSRFNQEVGLIEGERDDATGEFILYGGSALERVARNDELQSRKLFVPYQSITHYKLASDNSIAINNSRLKLNAGFQKNLRKEFGEVDEPGEASLFFDLETLHLNAQWQLPENNEWRTTIGLATMHQRNQNKGIEVIIPEYSLDDAGGFVFTQKNYDKLTLSGGLRFDNRSVNSNELIEGSELKFEAFKKSFANISGSAGLSYRPGDKVTVKLNLARGFRAPNLAELASNGAHEGTNRYEYGNLNLQSEQSLQADAGIDLNGEHISLRTSVFYNAIKDFIFYRKLNSTMGGDSIIMDGGETLLAFRFDQDNARLYGVEFNLDIHPHPLDWLHFENTFSYVRGTFREAQDGSKNLPLIPAPRLINELKIDLPYRETFLRNIYMRVELDNTFRQTNHFTGYGTETETPGYSLLNAGFGFDIHGKQNVLASIFFNGNNLTDVAYQHHLNRLKYAATNNATGRDGVFNMGRNFSLKVNVPITIMQKTR